MSDLKETRRSEILEPSTSASPSPLDADGLSGSSGGASATVKSVKEKGLNSLSFNMVRTMIQDLGFRFR